MRAVLGRRTVRTRDRMDRGTAGLLTLVLVLAVVTASTGWLTRAAADLHENGRSQAVADLAALSAVAADPDDARRVAAAVATDNGAELVSFRWHGTTVGVRIRLGGATASAHAQLGRTTASGR